MKTNLPYRPALLACLLAAGFALGTERSGAAPRPRPANPRSAYDPSAYAPQAYDPRAYDPGAYDPRAAAGSRPAGPNGPAPAEPARPTGPASPAAPAGPRGPGGPVGAGGVAGPRPPAAYLHALPADYEARTYGNSKYYYSNGVYYYEYANDGPAIYVPATMVNGTPTVPPRPYLYTLPAGYSIVNYGGASYYYYYGYYYYVYYINGRAVYALAGVPGSSPSVPPPPY